MSTGAGESPWNDAVPRERPIQRAGNEMSAAMLERLDDIDWYSLGHAYGDASDVPGTIRALASSDDRVRAKAWDDLFSSVRHQGDIYDSTPVVVPFLVELLADDSVPAKSELLQNFCY